MKIGLIGLGIMGKPMAKNILKNGYTDLMVSDLNKAAVDEVVAAGAKAATNQEIGEQCDVVLTMLPNSPHVKSVMLTPETGVVNFMHKGQVFIDMSSINPWLPRRSPLLWPRRALRCWMLPFPAASPRPSTAA